LLTVTLFSRKECRLCDDAEKNLAVLQEKFPHQLFIIDIDNDPELQKVYGSEVPVVQVGPYTLRSPINLKKLEMTLGASRDRKNQLEEIGDVEYKKRKARALEISKGDRFSIWFSKNYMLIFNLFVLIYVGLPFLAPVLMKVGAETPARVIYKVYSGLCHQLSYRSWFLFGDQPIYPRAAAGVEGFLTFHEATGLDEQGLIAARNFLGTDYLGYKVALCQRDVAIYLAILIFGLIFAATSRKVKPLPFWVWILFGMVPIGFDGVSQLLSQTISDPVFAFLQPYLGFFSYRESTPFLRTLTGLLFGLTTAWFGYPLIEEAMADTRRLLAIKIAQLEGKV
jgi:uncharacterized membrane protein